MTRLERSVIVIAIVLLLAATQAGADEPSKVAAATVVEASPAFDLAPDSRSVTERMDEVRSRVQGAVSYPAIARKRNVEGETLVAFEIGTNGKPRSVETIESSGSLVLDQAAEAAVEEAAPLPWIYGRVAVPVRFSLRDPSADAN